MPSSKHILFIYLVLLKLFSNNLFFLKKTQCVSGFEGSTCFPHRVDYYEIIEKHKEVHGPY